MRFRSQKQAIENKMAVQNRSRKTIYCKKRFEFKFCSIQNVSSEEQFFKQEKQVYFLVAFDQAQNDTRQDVVRDSSLLY